MVSIKPLGFGPAGTPMAVSLHSTRQLPTGNWRTFRPRYAERPSPCNLDCPAGTDVRAFLRFAADGDAERAWRTIREHNPFPGICGRVCYHPCEADCNRAGFDEPVAIHAVERAIASEARRLRLDPEPPEGGTAGPRVGVVGAGPAGLSCAYHLARRGFGVTVFDENFEAGGMLRYGIPRFRLPRYALDREMAMLARMGITFVNGVRVTSMNGAPDLTSYAALFLAIGAQRSKRLRIHGDTLRGVRPGLDLLREVNAGGGTPLFGRAVIIGGGNTAMDTARVAMRLGADVTVAYRRSVADMPAHPDEIAQARAEGVRLVPFAAPLRFLGSGGKVTGVELQRMRAGAPDASGRPQPEPIPGSTFTVMADHVFTAIGEEVEVDALQRMAAVAGGRLRADRWARTTKPSIFAGGDAATGDGTVVSAIGSGRRAAEAIAACLHGDDIVEAGVASRVDASDLNLFYFTHHPRAVPRSAPTPQTFDEVVSGLGWRQAVAEAKRCFTCGACTACDNCYVFCPDSAVQPNREAGTYGIDLSFCKGCGICAAECPRGVIALEPEASVGPREPRQ
jgi:NADPH-dependent glutamate synthase beta subunit-like oxidoreductase